MRQHICKREGSSVVRSHKIWKSIKGVLGYCPYTIAGKQIANKVSGNRPAEKKSETPNDNEIRLKVGMKSGRNIALVGLFCPIFWLSLFMGAAGSRLMANAIHSGIIIFMGSVYYSINYAMLRRLRLKL